jgi:hypothetical protein
VKGVRNLPTVKCGFVLEIRQRLVANLPRKGFGLQHMSRVAVVYRLYHRLACHKYVEFHLLDGSRA